jgi:hypothetical protein
VIDQELAAFVEGPVMMIFGTRSAAGLPAIGRALGVRVAADGASIDFFVSASQWTDALDGLSVGDQAALTFCRPHDYRAVQVKGELLSIGPTPSADVAVVDSYIVAVAQVLTDLGVLKPQMDQWLVRRDLVTLRLKPRAVFSQTPGPGAGSPLAGSAA